MKPRKNLSKTGFPGVYKAKNSNTYFFSSYVCDDPYTTKRTYHYGGWKTASEAWNAKVEFEKKANNEMLLELSKHTIGHLVAKFLNWKRNVVKLSTFHHIEGELVKYLSVPYGKMSITDFCHSTTLDKYRKEIVERDMSIGQKNKIFKHTVEAFKFGTDAEICKLHYYEAVSIKLTKININSEIRKKKKENFWTIDQWLTFINSIDPNDKWYVFFTLYGHIGCRLGEIRGLQNKHFNYANKTITIEQQALSNLGVGKTLITTPKTQSSNRVINIDPIIANMIKDLMHYLNSTNPDRFLFFNFKNPIGASTVRREFNKYIEKTGLPPITLHGIRHSNCTWLLSNDGLSTQQVSQVSKRLGHASTKETLDTYMHIHDIDDPAILNTLNLLLKKK